MTAVNCLKFDMMTVVCRLSRVKLCYKITFERVWAKVRPPTLL